MYSNVSRSDSRVQIESQSLSGEENNLDIQETEILNAMSHPPEPLDVLFGLLIFTLFVAFVLWVSVLYLLLTRKC